MARTGPSVADQALLNELAGRGVTLPASRLERWRHVGLIARPRQHWSGGGGSRTRFDQPLDVVADHVAAVAARARRGQPAPLTAVAISADGYPVDGQLLRAGHRMSMATAAAVFADIAAAARAQRASPPIDELDEAEQVAAVILDGRANSAPWRRNLKAHRDLAAPDDVDLVLGSATTAMVQLIAGDQPSPGAMVELSAALGIRAFATALATDCHDSDMDSEDIAAAVADMMSALFAGGPIVARLTAALDAPASVLDAASRLVTGLWAVIDGSGALGQAFTMVPAPTGDNPPMHSIAVAWMLEHVRGDGIDIAPLLEIGSALALIDAPTAEAMSDAAATLLHWRANPAADSLAQLGWRCQACRPTVQ